MTKPLTDQKKYEDLQKRNESKWESLCNHCGACCGIVEGDPCEHLQVGPNKTYLCSIYKNRFGRHKTISGKELNCVPIRKILHQSWPGDACCGYKSLIKKGKAVIND